LRELPLDAGGELARDGEVGGGRRRVGGVEVGLVVERARVAIPLPGPEVVDEEATGDRERPREDGGAGQEPATRAVDPEERLLDEVLGARVVPRLPRQVAEEPGCEEVVELG